MELHLLSLPGPRSDPVPSPCYIYDICASILEGKSRPQIVYLPDADPENRFGDFTEVHFSQLGEVMVVCSESLPLAELQQKLSPDALFYVPGGNSFQLASKLSKSGYLGFIKERITVGTPYIGFSAGAVITGVTIQTSNVENETDPVVETLRVFPFGVNAHFPTEAEERNERVAGLKLVSRREKTRILAIEDDAYLTFDGSKVIAKKPGIWIIDGRNGNEKAEQILSLNLG